MFTGTASRIRQGRRILLRSTTTGGTPTLCPPNFGLGFRRERAETAQEIRTRRCGKGDGGPADRSGGAVRDLRQRLRTPVVRLARDDWPGDSIGLAATCIRRRCECLRLRGSIVAIAASTDDNDRCRVHRPANTESPSATSRSSRHFSRDASQPGVGPLMMAPTPRRGEGPSAPTPRCRRGVPR